MNTAIEKQSLNPETVNVTAKVVPIPLYGDLLGCATVHIGGLLTIRGVRVLYEENDPVVKIPGVDDGTGGEMEVCGIDTALKTRIEAITLEQYRIALEKIREAKPGTQREPKGNADYPRIMQENETPAGENERE